MCNLQRKWICLISKISLDISLSSLSFWRKGVQKSLKTNRRTKRGQKQLFLGVDKLCISLKLWSLLMHHSLYPYLNSTVQISFHLLVAQYTLMPELVTFVIPCIGAHGYCSIFYRPATSSRRVQTEVLKCEKDMS